MLNTFGLFFVMFVKLGKFLFSNREYSHKFLMNNAVNNADDWKE